MDCIYLNKKNLLSSREFTRCFGSSFEMLQYTDNNGLYAGKCMCCNKTDIKHKFAVEILTYETFAEKNKNTEIEKQPKLSKYVPRYATLKN